MKATVEIVGLDRVRRLMSTMPSVLNTELRRGVRDSAAVLRSQAISNIRQFAVDRRFEQSIRYHVTGGRNIEALIGSMASTALSIEEGRKPGEIVKLGLIRSWLEHKGLVRGVFSVKTQRMRKRVSAKAMRLSQPDITREEIRMAAKIVEEIRQHGTKPHAFLIPALRQQELKVRRLISESVSRALQRFGRAA